MTAHRAMHLVSRLPVLLAAFLAAAPQHALGDDFPWLDTLDAGGNVQASGTKLIALPLDLHRLDRDDGSPSTATIAVHGCPGTAADALSERLSQAPFTDLDRIRLIGHSYGGVLVTVSAERWQGSVPLDVHAIAAPLAGVGDRCPYQTPSTLPPKVAFHEWRTRHQLDGAFRSMPVDPQVIELPGSNVTRLPATYNGRRLGHNWSVSWVGDMLTGRTPSP